MDYFSLLLLFPFGSAAYNTNITDFHKFESKVGPEKPNFLCPDSCLKLDWYDRCCTCAGKPIWELNRNISYDPVFVEYTNMFGQSKLLSKQPDATFQWLKHRNGRMNALPQNVCKYNNTLVSVVLTGNKIQSIEGVNCMWHLDTLDLSQNPVSSISKTTFSGMPNLRVLILADTNIQKLEPYSFSNFDTEIFLTDLSGNNFKSLDVTNIFFERRPYCNITLSRCNISFSIANSFDLSLNKSYGGGEVMLTDSEIIDSIHPFTYVFGDSKEKLKQVYKHDIYGRFTFNKLNISCDCYMGELLLAGEEFYQKFFSEELYYCTSPDHMKGTEVQQAYNDSSPITMDMFVCHKQSFCPRLCSCIEQPNRYRLVVDCSNRNLTSLPSYLPKTVYDIELNCSNNFITDVQPVNYLNNVTILDLSGNQVSHISDSVPSELKRLEKLILTDHELHRLSREFVNLDAGKIWFGQNSISCPCDDIWIESWRKVSKVNESNVLMCKTESGYINEAEEAFIECLPTDSSGPFWLLFILPCVLLASLIIAHVFRFDFLLFKRRLQKPKSKSEYTSDIFILCDEENEDVLKVVIDFVLHFEKQGYQCFAPPLHGLPGDVREDMLKKNIRNCRSVLAILSLPEGNHGDTDEVVMVMNHAWKLYLSNTIENLVAVIFDGKFAEQKNRFPYLGSLNRFNRVFKVRSRKYDIKRKIRETLPLPTCVNSVPKLENLS